MKNRHLLLLNIYHYYEMHVYYYEIFPIVIKNVIIIKYIFYYYLHVTIYCNNNF